MKNTIIIVLITSMIVVVALGSFLYIMLSPNKTSIKNNNQGIPCELGGVFITNVKNSKHILKSEIVVEVEDKNSKKNFENNLYKVRDNILYILSNVNEEELMDPIIQVTLKEKIQEKIQNILNYSSITNIYFKEFVWQ